MQEAPTFDALVKPFAISILAKTTALKTLALTRSQATELRNSIAFDFRKCGNVLIPVHLKYEISRAAWDTATAMGADLRQLLWSSPFIKVNRKTFELDHVETIGAMTAAAMKVTTPEEMVELIRRTYRVAWILKSENKELNRLGYRIKRPDPDVAYREAGIELMKRADYGDA